MSEVKLSQPNMMRLSPDSRRRDTLDEKFQVDFDRFATGAARPHDMLLM